VSIQPLLLTLALVVGALTQVQMVANAELANGVAGTIAATIISFTAGWFILIIINAAGFRQFPLASDIARTPVHLLVIRGAIGALFVGVNVRVAPRLGSAATMSLVIAGQLVGALAVDRLGLFAFTVRLGPPRRRVARVRRRVAGAFSPGARNHREQWRPKVTPEVNRATAAA
jgi:bacterial/archaeal transporter family-2 protein